MTPMMISALCYALRWRFAPRPAGVHFCQSLTGMFLDMSLFRYSYAKPPLFRVHNSRSALSTLELSCAGILSWRYPSGKFLVSDSGVTIVDFSHSKQSDDQGAMDKEYALLCFFPWLRISGQTLARTWREHGLLSTSSMMFHFSTTTIA